MLIGKNVDRASVCHFVCGLEVQFKTFVLEVGDSSVALSLMFIGIMLPLNDARPILLSKPRHSEGEHFHEMRKCTTEESPTMAHKTSGFFGRTSLLRDFGEVTLSSQFLHRRMGRHGGRGEEQTLRLPCLCLE